MIQNRFPLYLIIPVLILFTVYPVTQPLASILWNGLPLAFTVDAEQNAIHFQANGLGGVLTFRAPGFALELNGGETIALEYLGANPSPQIEPADQLPGTVNQFKATLQRTDIPTYGTLFTVICTLALTCNTREQTAI